MLHKKIEGHLRIIEDFPIKGVSFKDITPLFQKPELCKEIITELAEPIRGEVDVVCGIESRGFLFGFPLALELNVPFVLIRKKGKLPPPVISQAYELEYGSSEIEMIEGQIKEGQRVLLHDDVLATGGTTSAAIQLITNQNAIITHVNFIINLRFLKGYKKLEALNLNNIHSILSYD